MNRALWIVQGLLAPLFLFAGGVKLVMPLDEMVAESGPAGLVHPVPGRGRGAGRARPDPAGCC